MPWILQQAKSPWAWQDYKSHFQEALRLRHVETDYQYTSNNSYSFCPEEPVVSYGEQKNALTASIVPVE